MDKKVNLGIVREGSAGYNRLWHLVRALYPLSDLSRAHLVMISTYFDASGWDGRSPVIVVAGYLSTADRWIEFENRWKIVLDDHGVTGFHWHDFAHSLNEFKTWKGNEKKRKDFLGSLICEMERYIHHGFVATFPVEHFHATNKEYFFEEHLGPPYVTSAVACVGYVIKWMIEAGYDDASNSFDFIFEDGDYGKGKMYEIVERLTKIRPIFRKKSEHGALQASDFLAAEYRKLRDDYARNIIRPRGSLKSMLEKIPTDCWEIAPETLQLLCSQNNTPRRF